MSLDGSRLPLPVAVLLRRARNAKSAKERHDTAYFAWEASLRLLVAAQPPRDLSGLARASVGQWVQAARAEETLLDAPALLDAFALLTEAGTGRKEAPRSVHARRLLDALPAYRNHVVGHGSTRAAGFYEEAGPRLAAGLSAAWDEGVFGGSELLFADAVEITPDGRRLARLLQLRGSAAHVVDPCGTEVPEDLLPRRVYLRDGDLLRPLHPLVLFVEETYRERVLFFNGFARRAEYLEYASGEVLRGDDLERSFPGIEDSLRKLLGEVPASPAPARDDDPRLFGDYELLGTLGQGGMGVVHLARQRSLDRLVALKLLPAGSVDDPTAVARFEREIAALARCDHPNVVKILASGRARGTPYYAMEYVEGADLARVAKALRSSSDLSSAVSTASGQVREERRELFDGVPAIERNQPPRPREKIRELGEAFRDAARGLDHLHAHGIVHRDVKPGNLMLTAGEHRLVVMDLGLATLADASRSLTRDKGQVLGTLRYMPPEQLQRSLLQVDRRADVYALGATFYELFTGRAFFDGDSEARLIEQVLREDPVPPRNANPELSIDLATILGKATQKDPRFRYDTAEALAHDIDAWLDGRPIAARPPTLGYVVGLVLRRHKPVAVTVALALLALAGLSGLYVHRVSTERDRALGAESVAERRAEEADQARLAAQDEQAAKERARAASQDALRRSDGLRLLSSSTLALDTDAGLALLLAIEGAKRAPGLQANNALLAALRQQYEKHVIRPATAGSELDENSTSVAFSPDGSRVATIADSDTSLRVWDVQTGAEVASVAAPRRASPRHSPSVVDYSPDGRLIVVARVRGALLFDATSLSPVGELEASPDHGGTLLSMCTLAFDRTGHRVVGAFGSNIAHVWDVESRSETAVLRGHESFIRALAVAPSGDMVATASEDRTARVWDLVTGRERLRLAGHRLGVESVGFDPGATTLVTGSADGTARVWRLDTGAEIAVLPCEGSVDAVAFDPSGGTVFTGGWDSILRTWDAKTGRLLFSKPLATPWINHLRASPDGPTVAAATMEGDVLVYSARDRALRRLGAHEGRATGVVFSPDGRSVASTGWDGTVRLWTSGAPDRVVAQEQGLSVLWPGNLGGGGPVVTTVDLRQDRVVAVEDPRSRSTLAQLGGDNGPAINSASFSPDGTRIVTSGDSKVATIWDVASGEAVVLLGGHGSTVRHAEFSTRGDVVVTASAWADVRVFDAATGRQVGGLSPHCGSAWHASFDPAGDRVAAAFERRAYVWNWRDDSKVPLIGHDARVLQARFDPGGTRVATASYDGTVRIWDAAGGQERLRLTPGGGEVLAVAFSPDGRLVATCGAEGVVRLFDAETGAPVSGFRGHERAVFSVDFLDGGSHLISAADDGTSRVWQVSTGETIATYDVPRGRVFDWRGSVVALQTVHLAGSRTDLAAHVRPAGAGSITTRLDGHSGEITRAAVTEDGLVTATASEDATVCLWRTADGRLLHRLTGHDGHVRDLTFTRDGARLVSVGGLPSEDADARIQSSADEQGAIVWDVATGEPLHTMRRAMHAATSADGRLIALATPYGTEVRELVSGAMLRRLGWTEDSGGYVDGVDISPDGRLVATSPRRKPPVVWDAATGARVALLDAVRPSEWSYPVFDHSGTYLLISGSQPDVARVYETSRFQEILTIPDPPFDRFIRFEFDQDDAYVSFHDATGRVWRAPLDLLPAAERATSRGLTASERMRFEIAEDAETGALTRSSPR